MIDILVSVAMMFLPVCTQSQWQCQGGGDSVRYANFHIGSTGHYVETVNGRITVHETYPFKVQP